MLRSVAALAPVSEGRKAQEGDVEWIWKTEILTGYLCYLSIFSGVHTEYEITAYKSRAALFTSSRFKVIFIA